MTFAGTDDNLYLIDLLDRLLRTRAHRRCDDLARRSRPRSDLVACTDQLGSHAGGRVSRLPARIDAEPETVRRDLGRLVLTIVELLRQLMERQAIRRVEAGDLPEETVERLGLGLLRLEEAMDELREYFGLRPEDLNIDLGPLGNLLPPPER